jgi:NAD(P)-dependent dehydrogenase (short-subunit alcohol dehydrogenase family)
MKDRTAFVTGAGGGMGLAIARELHGAGARVALVDLKPSPSLGERSLVLQGDLADEAFVAAAFAKVADELGSLDYLVNAAGVLWFDRDRSALDIDLDVWDRVMTINLKSAVHTVRHAVPLMRKTGRGGAMVHIATTQCLRGDSKPQDAYQASKAGLIALSKSLAIQLASECIRSNVIVPGPTASPMQERWTQNPGAEGAVAAAIPLGRVGKPEDMANACAFLLSDKASFITGTELVVDGGLLALP